MPVVQMQPSNIRNIIGVGGEKLNVVAQCSLPIVIQNRTLTYNFYVFNKLHHSLIIGIDGTNTFMLQ